MGKVKYIVEFYTKNGVWVDFPPCDDAEVASYLVKAILRASSIIGEVVRVRRVDNLVAE